MPELPKIREEMLSAFGAAADAAGAGTYMSGGTWHMEVTEEQVRAGLAAALVASGWRPEAEVLRDAGKSIERHIDSYQVVSRQLIQQMKTRTADPELIRQRQRLERRYMRGMWAAADDVYELAEAADERTAERATALESVGALPVADGSFGAVVHEQGGLKGTSKDDQERSEGNDRG